MEQTQIRSKINPKEEQKNVTGEVLLSWRAPEYHHYEKSVDWYWWVGLAAVVLLGFAFWQKSFLFGVLVLVGWFTVVLHAIRHPEELNFSVTENGVLIEKTFYPWHTLKSFWIFYNPPLFKELSLESQKTLMPFIKIPLGDVKPAQIKNIVSRHLEEIEQQESLIDHLAHLARF